MNKKNKIIIFLLLSILIFSSLQSNANENLKVEINDNDVEYNCTEVNKVQEEYLKEIKEKEIAILIADIKGIKKEEKKTYTELKDFIVDVSGLSREDSSYLIEASEKIGVDPMLMLSLIRVESFFDPYLVGTSGERGIGQLMANTAKPVAESIGVEYDPDKLFEPKYNILLFTTQFKYLLDYYDGDLHKTLTAYNRGQYGLEKYMASRSSHSRPEVSIYSSTVLEYASEYKNQFDNSK
ncbi:MAG: transglycosylase SLT domain-containing protein [Bacillota bacterium]|nr:transglycosylase SLT domain-containing protein [Bacillota bacterium]